MCEIYEITCIFVIEEKPLAKFHPGHFKNLGWNYACGKNHKHYIIRRCIRCIIAWHDVLRYKHTMYVSKIVWQEFQLCAGTLIYWIIDPACLSMQREWFDVPVSFSLRNVYHLSKRFILKNKRNPCRIYGAAKVFLHPLY